MDDDDLLETIRDMLPEDWDLEDGFGLDFNLICPHGYTIEQDGKCPEGCESPLRRMGLI